MRPWNLVFLFYLFATNVAQSDVQNQRLLDCFLGSLDDRCADLSASASSNLQNFNTHILSIDSLLGEGVEANGQLGTIQEGSGSVNYESLTLDLLGVDLPEATRIFANDKDYPPKDFAAYAIIAFKSGADSSTLSRHLMICEAYVRAIPPSRESSVSTQNQLVTVWPLANRVLADDVHKKETVAEKCKTAVDGYGHVQSLRALRHARLIDKAAHEQVVNNRGPFLLAWSPGGSKGQNNALLLRMDLSDVDLDYQARHRFEFWVQRIEGGQELWGDGWQTVPLRQRIGEAADRFGVHVLKLIGI